MSRQDKVNAENLRKQAGEAGKVARQFADQGVEWAGPRVDAAKEWAGPKVDAAVDWASPRVEKAFRSGVQAPAPRVADYAEKSRGAVDAAHDTITETVIPRGVDAMENAAKAAAEGADGLQQKAGSALDAASEAAQEQTKRSGKVGKTLGWVLAGAAVAGAGVLIWKRTQPTEDPWAEEYWDDAPATTPATPATPATPSATTARHAATGSESGAEETSTSAPAPEPEKSAGSPHDSDEEASQDSAAKDAKAQA